jgi:hypothetical protein
MATRRLCEIAKTIRSKNAGVDKITFDVIFADPADFDLVCRSHVLSRAAVCRIFGIPAGRITDWVAFEPALAIKFTISRTISSGSPGDADIFGSQQYGPLMEIEVPVTDPKPRGADNEPLQ